MSVGTQNHMASCASGKRAKLKPLHRHLLACLCGNVGGPPPKIYMILFVKCYFTDMLLLCSSITHAHSVPLHAHLKLAEQIQIWPLFGNGPLYQFTCNGENGMTKGDAS